MTSPWSWQPGPPPYLTANLSDEVKAHTWNRALWGGEVAFAVQTLTNPGYTDMLLCIQVNLPLGTVLTMDHVRQATRALRWDHPGIAATVVYPPFTSLADFKLDEIRLLYQTASGEKEVAQWLDKVAFDKSSYLLAADGDLDRAFDALKADIGASWTLRDKWMFKVFYLGDEQSNKHGIMIHTGHTIFDGHGTFEVLDLWLHALVELLTKDETEKAYQWGEEASRLAKAVPDRSATPWSPEPTPADHPVLKEIAESLKLPADVQFGLPVMHPVALPTTTGTILKMFPAPLADNLRLTARAHGVGVFALIVAADHLTSLALNPPTTYTDELYTRILPNASDLRGKYLAGGTAAKKDRSKWQVASALGGGAVNVRHLERFLKSDNANLSNDVLTLAKEIQEQVTRQAPSLVTAAQWVPEAMTMLLGSFSPPDATHKDTHVRIVNVSSMGLMDDSLSASYPAGSDSPVFSISKPVFTGIGPGFPFGAVGALVHPYTWQGTLFLSFSFPSAYMGTVEEQKERNQRGEATLYGFVQRFSGLLQTLADPVLLPN